MVTLAKSDVITLKQLRVNTEQMEYLSFSVSSYCAAINNAWLSELKAVV